VFINNTIVENTADIPGGASSHGGAMCVISSSPVFFNTIIYGNKAVIGNQVHLQNGSQPAYVFCVIEGGSKDFARDGVPNGSYSGTYVSNIDTNPLFISTLSDNYHLTDNSPCIGAGSDSIMISHKWFYAPSYGYEGNLRPSPAGSMPDIGACENTLGTPTKVKDELTTPKEFTLYQNYPNPFNPSTRIIWRSPVSGWQTLKVFDILGNEIIVLVNEYRPAGDYEVEFDAAKISSGVYFYQLKAGDFVQTKKMILLR
jgi:hypothetical protein